MTVKTLAHDAATQSCQYGAPECCTECCIEQLLRQLSLQLHLILAGKTLQPGEAVLLTCAKSLG